MSFLYQSIQDFPLDIGQTDVTLRAVNVVGEQRNPFGEHREVQVFPGARWEIEISFLPTERADAQRFEAWMLSLRGRAGLFRCADPYRSLPLGSNLGAPRVKTAIAGEEAFISRGWADDEFELLLAGDHIELEGRLHMVLANVSSDGNGDAEIRVWPPLRQTYEDGVHIVTENARGVFALADNNPEFTRDVTGLNGKVLRAIEVPTFVATPAEAITLGGLEFTLGGESLGVVPP